MRSPRVSTTVVGLAVAAVLLAFPGVGAGQTDEALRKRIEALEAGQRAMLKQLEEIKALLQARTAPQPPVDAKQAPGAATQLLSLDGAASRGSQQARLTLIEFSDFECPFCGRYFRDTLQQVMHEYVDTGKVRYVFRNYPLEQLHPHAFKAAEAGDCALQQGKFWQMHTRMFANQQALGDVDLLNHAKAVGLDPAAFQRCVTGSVVARIRRDLDEGSRAGITGTPTFFLGVVQQDGRMKVSSKLTGAQPFTAFKTTIDGLLRSLAPAN